MLLCAALLIAATACSGGPEASQTRENPWALRGNDSLPIDEAVLLQINVHCGSQVIYADGVHWRTDEPGADVFDWMPDEWYGTATSSGTDLAVVSVVLSYDESALVATRNDRSVTYRQMTSEDPEFICM